MDNITKLASLVMARRAVPQSGLAGIIKIAMLKLAETKYDTKLLNESLHRMGTAHAPVPNPYSSTGQNYSSHYMQSQQDSHNEDIQKQQKYVANMKQQKQQGTWVEPGSDVKQGPFTRASAKVDHYNAIDPHSYNDKILLRERRQGSKSVTDPLQQRANNAAAGKGFAQQTYETHGTNKSLAVWRDNTAQSIAKNFGRQGVSGIDVNTTQQNLGMGEGKGFIPKYQAAGQRMAQMRSTAKINTPAPGMPLAKDLGNFISGQGEWGKKAVDFTKGLYNTVAPHVQKAWNYMTAPAPINKNISSGFRPAYGV